MTEAQRIPERTYVWQGDKPLHMSRWQEIRKGETFTPSVRLIRAFGDLMLTESEAQARAEEDEADAKAQEEKAERAAARAARIAEGGGRPDYRDLAVDVQAHRQAEREGTTSHAAAERQEGAQAKRATTHEPHAQPKRSTKE